MPTFTRTPQGCTRRNLASRSRIVAANIVGPGGRPAPQLRCGARNFQIVGTTLDAAGAPLAGCTVRLFRTGDDSLVATTSSDGAGAFQFVLSGNAGTFYVSAYKGGSPDVAGTTVNTLIAT